MQWKVVVSLTCCINMIVFTSRYEGYAILVGSTFRINVINIAVQYLHYIMRVTLDYDYANVT
jgi:hypothetical protein